MRTISPWWPVACAVSLAQAATCGAAENVTHGPEIDYQPSIIRSTDDDALVLVFERLDPSSFAGDLWLTRSGDGGRSWSAPAPIVATTANERHPALIQTGPDAYALFYLKGTGAGSTFRIWRATSIDGVSFDEIGALDLGWPGGGEINPTVVRHADGTLTMSYQRLSGGSYVAVSHDDGASWDTARTLLAADALLPRIAYRESDRRYLATYQTNPGNDELRMFVKTTTDPSDWSGAPIDFAVSGNNHDSLPVVMPDDAFVVFYIRASGNQFDIASRRSLNGVDFSPPLAITQTPDEDDVEPHPLVGASAARVDLYWGRDAPAGALAYDIVHAPGAAVVDAIFGDAFDG